MIVVHMHYSNTIIIDIVTNQRKRLSYFGVGRRRRKKRTTRTIEGQILPSI